MPDSRRHRGPHPEDARLFDQAAWPVLRRATADLCWLLSRRYAAPSALKLVGDRYQLDARQRTAIRRCACADDARMERSIRCVAAGALTGRPLRIDGYNVLTTVEAALGGGVLLAAADGSYRDLASLHGTYRAVAETREALRLIGRVLAELGARPVVWYFDRPVSNSGRLGKLVRELASGEAWAWQVELVPDPDPILAASEEIVATADHVVLDRCRAWFNLAREVVDRRISDATVLPLGREDQNRSKSGLAPPKI